VRDGRPRTLSESPELAVADRQILWRMDVTEGACRPLRDAETMLGALIFSLDEDLDTEFAMTVYGEELTRWIVRATKQMDPAGGTLARYREREEKRLRELVHEANNPLSVVYNYLHILELRLQHEPSAVEQLRMIGDELKRTGDIIRRARELPPVEEPELTGTVEISAVDVNRLVGHVFELHRGYAADRGVTLEQDMATGALVVASDESRLIQVLTNLLRNAIEAASGGSVIIGSLGGVFRDGVEGVELSVADSGPGLPREVLERLGEPKQSAKGGDHAGLGLHIVHRLVEEVKARIDVRTGPETGTTFTIFLPLSQPV
jgi:signal transduction histidine kinase